MIHLDLFSGIAGFALAVEEVWPGSEHIFVEIDPYCQALLKKRFEGSLIYGDIRELTRERFVADTYHRGQAEQELKTTGDKQCDRGAFAYAESEQSGQSSEQKRGKDIGGGSLKIDLITGGFPCQGFSQAGKRRGTKDDRYLWPEMFRVIKIFTPRFVIAENVRGIVNIENGMVFEQVCLDLENEGYEVQAFIIPAVAVGAPHRRDRVWFLAKRTIGDDTESERWNNGNASDKRKTARNVNTSRMSNSNAPDTEAERLQGANTERRECSDGRYAERFRCEDWNEPWLPVAVRTCSRRVDDGISTRIHGLTSARHRVERLKALGNSICPQVAIEIMKAIKESI